MSLKNKFKANTYRDKRPVKMVTGQKRMNKSLRNFFNKDPRLTHFQSTKTWQNTIYKISFPKQKRFWKNRNSNDLIYDIPTTKTPRACSFGYGQKAISSLARRLNDKNNPPPDRYSLPEFCQENMVKSRGKTFGINHRYYDRVYMDNPNQTSPQEWTAKNLPGPDTYDAHKQKIKLKKGVSYSLRTKGIMFNAKSYTDFVPGSNTYLPNLTLVQPHSLGKIKQGLGLGKRGFVHNNFVKGYPGPGSYSIPTFCDKILKRYQTLKGTMTYSCGNKVFPYTKLRRRRKRRFKRKKGYKSARLKNDKNATLQKELKVLIGQQKDHTGKEGTMENNEDQ